MIYTIRASEKRENFIKKPVFVYESDVWKKTLADFSQYFPTKQDLFNLYF